MAQEAAPRTLGTSASVALVAGAILGTSAYVAPALVAARAGSAPLDVLVWVVAGGLAILGAATYAELATLLPRAGGPYVFLREALGPTAGFLAGWGLLAPVRTAALAALALVSGGYLAALLPNLVGGVVGVRVAGIVVLLLAMAANLATPRRTTRVLEVLVAVAVAGSLAVVVGGLVAPSTTGIPPSPIGPGLLGSLPLAILPALLALDGWSILAEVGGDVVDPGRRIPPVLVGSVAGATLLLVLLDLVYLRVLGPAGLAASPLPAATVAAAAWGTPGATLGEVTVLAATAAALTALLLGMNRVLGAMTGDGVLPPAIGGSLEPGNRYRGVLVQGTLAGVVVIVPALPQLLVAAAAPLAWVLLAAVAVTLPLLRQRRPDAPRPYHVWGYPLVPGAFAAVAALAALWTAASRPAPALLGIVLVVAGLPVLRVSRGQSPVPPWLDVRPQPAPAGDARWGADLDDGEQELLAYLLDLRHHGAPFHAREAAKALGASERAIYENLAGLREKRPERVRIGFWDGALHVRAAPDPPGSDPEASSDGEA